MFKASLLKFFWQTRGFYAGTICPWPLSKQGYVSFNVPAGATVHGQAPLGDGTRGTLGIWADWWRGLGGTSNTLTIALLETGDPVPPLYDITVPNAQAGRFAVTVSNGESSADCANQVAGSLALAMGMVGIAGKFDKANGRVQVFNPMPGDGSVAILSPVPWRAMVPFNSDGAWEPIGDMVITEGIFRGFLMAGLRPAPWMVSGDASPGLGEEHSIIG
jgi:hypothetical protein